MNIFRNRPLALAGCLFAIFAVLGFSATGTQKLIVLSVVFIGILILTLISCVCRRIGRFRALGLLCLGAVLLSLVSSYQFFNVRYAAMQERNGKPCVAEGVVVEYLSGTSYSAAYRVRLETIDGERTDADAMLECGYASALQRGDRFRVQAVPRAFTQDERFNEESYRLSDGCMTVLVCDSADQCERTGRETQDILLNLSALNTRLAYRLRNDIGGEAGGLASALFLGNRSWIPADTTLDFQRAGISHLLALSGLHVSIIIGFLELLFRRLRLSKLFRAILIPCFAVGYLAITGFSVSTARAVLMVCVLYLAFLFGSEYDALTALSLALAVILGLTPYAVLDLSLWMSFLAAASILIFSPAVLAMQQRWKGLRRLPRWLRRAISGTVSAIAVGTVANLALLLLSGSVFGEVSLASVPATLILSIPVTVLLILSALLLLVPFVPIIPWMCSILGEMILRIVARTSEIEDVLLPVKASQTMVWIVLLSVVLILLAILPLKSKLWALPVPVLCVCIAVSSVIVTHNMEPSVHTFRTGRGEVRLYTEAGHAVVINDTSGAASGAYEIRTAALAARCSEINDVVLTDYYNQVTYFIASVSGTIKLRNLHLPTPTDERERGIATRLEQEAGLHGIAVHYDAELWVAAYEG